MGKTRRKSWENGAAEEYLAVRGEINLFTYRDALSNARVCLMPKGTRRQETIHQKYRQENKERKTKS